MNFTTRRLRSMRPGDSIVFYRGNLAADIERNWGAPLYRELLQEIAATARELERDGSLILSEQPATITTEVTIKNGTKVVHSDKIIVYTAVRQ